MDEFLSYVWDIVKKLSIPVGIGILGTLIHLHRTKERLTIIQVVMQIIVNVAIVYGTSIFCVDFFEIKNERLVWVMSGVACSFSTYILNLIQLIITDIAPDAARKLFNVEKKNKEN